MDEFEFYKEFWEGKMFDIEKVGKLVDKLCVEVEEEGEKIRKFLKLFNFEVKEDEEIEEESGGFFLGKIKEVVGNLVDVVVEVYDDVL